MRGLLLQDCVGRQADGVGIAFGFQELVDLGFGEGRIRAEVAAQFPLAIALDHRLKHSAPILGAVDITGTQEAPLQVAELNAAKERVGARAVKVPIVSRALLITLNWALGAIHVEDDELRLLALMNPVDPGTGEIAQGRQVLIRGKPLRLEAPHLTGRGCTTIKALAIHDGAHRRVAR